MKIDEEDETLRSVVRNDPEEGEYKFPDTYKLAHISMWVHAKTNILLNGRTTHLDPEEPTDLPDGEEFDPDAAKVAIEAADPFEARLKPLDKDGHIKRSSTNKISPWSVRLMGDATEYGDEKAPNTTVSNGVVIVRSMIWPGSYSVYYRGRTIQIYVGNGHKNTQTKSMFPVNPPEVLDDPDEYDEGPEPTPLHAPPEVEVKNDEDKKDGDDDDGDDDGDE